MRGVNPTKEAQITSCPHQKRNIYPDKRRDLKISRQSTTETEQAGGKRKRLKGKKGLSGIEGNCQKVMKRESMT